MVVARTPKSTQAEHKARYMEHLSEQARAFHHGRAPLTGNLYARIAWIHRYRGGPNADNIAKPILDSLKGIVFADDDQVVQCIIDKIYSGPGTTPTIVDRNQPASDVYDKLLTLIFRGQSDVLYVEVGAREGQQLTFGPPDRGDQ
jgi:Holliday junction resolvase RusA-like endonuclease